MINNNIKFIIKKYLTYSDDQLNEFKKNWKSDILKTNKLFKISGKDYNQLCYICSNKDHMNFECPNFYYHVDIINNKVLK